MGWLGVAMAIGNDNMRDLHYKNRTIRLADDVWEDFKIANEKNGLSWNLFIKKIIKELKQHEQKSK